MNPWGTPAGRRLAFGFIALFAWPQGAHADDPAALQRLSEMITVQAQVYGIEDRCLKVKIPQLELRTLLAKSREVGAPPPIIALIQASYVDGIKAAANIDCRLAGVILGDLDTRHGRLAAAQPPK